MNTLAVFLINFSGLLPDPDPVAPPGTEGVTTIISWVKWGALIVAVLALIAAGAMIGLQRRRGEGDEGIGWIAKILVGVVIIGGAVSLISFLAGV